MKTPKLEQGNFYGETLKRYQAGGFNLSETHYQPGVMLPRHSHETHYFCFILNGTYKETFDGGLRSCQPSMIVYHPAGEQHEQHFDSTVQLFRLEVRNSEIWRDSFTDQCLRYGNMSVGGAVGLSNKLYREFRQPDEVSHLAIEGLALELITGIVRDSRSQSKNNRKAPRWLTTAYDLIKSRYLEHLTLSDIASEVNVHPVTLAREFRSRYACTVGEMMRRERIDFAARELQDPRKPQSEIALSAGFYDQSHFARTFKKMTGLTPEQYRLTKGLR